jgi:hypothetical protein
MGKAAAIISGMPLPMQSFQVVAKGVPAAAAAFFYFSKSFHFCRY